VVDHFMRECLASVLDTLSGVRVVRELDGFCLLRGQPAIEPFNGRLRDECLNEHVFRSLSQARALVEAYRID
jgi:putative transposase